MDIRWPERYEPSRCAIHVRNEILIPAPPGPAFAWLIRAAWWPRWYPNARDVVFFEGEPPDLKMGTRFRWKTFGIAIEARVLEFEPPSRIAWDARGLGVDAWHAWLLEPTPEGCRVVTEETQRGWLSRLNSLVFPHRMFRWHQNWLEGLREQATKGAPP